MPDKVFWCRVYSNVDEENESIESYLLRPITIENGNTWIIGDEFLGMKGWIGYLISGDIAFIRFHIIRYLSAYCGGDIVR